MQTQFSSQLRKLYKSNSYSVPSSNCLKVMVVPSPALLSSATILEAMVILSPTPQTLQRYTFCCPSGPELCKHHKSSGFYVPGSRNCTEVTVILFPALISSANIVKVVVDIRRFLYQIGENLKKKVKINQWSQVEPQFARKLISSSHFESAFSLIFIDFAGFSMD